MDDKDEFLFDDEEQVNFNSDETVDEDFSFVSDDAGEDNFSFDSDEDSEEVVEDDSADWDGFDPEKKSGSKRLLYLLLLMFVLLGGAVYVLFLAPADGPSPPVKVVTAPRKPVATSMPKPIAAPVPKPVAAPVPKPVAAPVPKPAQPEKSATVTVSPSPVEVKETSSLPAKPEAVVAEKSLTPAQSPDVLTESNSESNETVEPEAEVAKTEPKLFESRSATAPAAEGAYTLSAGAFALQSSVDGVLEKISKLGYQGSIQKLHRKIPMMRLLVGVYSADTAAKKLSQVKQITDGAFSLVKGDKVAVYAGSFFVLDQARIFADRTLYKSGIRVTEEPVEVDQTLQRVTFGSFASKDDAAKISLKASGLGLDAKPVRK
jgi:hypothetical protein